LRKADTTRGHGEGSTEGELKHKKERKPAADARTVHRAKVADRAAGVGKRGTEFGPDEAVADHEQGAEDPAHHRLWAVHRRHDERNSDERADADHVDHVQRGRVPEADAPDESVI